MKNLIFVVILSSFVIPAWANSLKNEVDALEKEFLAELSKKNVSQEVIFYHYLLAGRETFTLGADDYSKKYFLKAIEMKVNENKSEAYVDLIALAHRNKDFPEKKKLIQNLIKYYDKNPQYLNVQMKSYLNYLKNDKLDHQLEPYFGHFNSINILENLIKNKSYLQAYLMLNLEGLKDADIGIKTTYDLLNCLVNKRKVKKYLCMDTYKKYPTAYSYSIKICGALEQYSREGKVSPTRIDDLKNFFNKNYQDKSFLAVALEDLK